MGFVPHQPIAGRKIADPTLLKDPKDLAEHFLWIRNVFVYMRTDNNVKTVVFKREVKCISEPEFQIAFLIGSFRVVNSRLIDIDADYLFEMICQIIVDNPGRTTNIEQLVFIQGCGQVILEYGDHGSGLSFPPLDIVNIWAVEREVILITTVQTDTSGDVACVCALTVE